MTAATRSTPKATDDSPFDAVGRVAASLRYQDLGDLAGMRGIAVTRRCSLGLPHVTFVLAEPHGTRVAFDGAWDPALPPDAEIRRIMCRPVQPDPEIRCLRMILPGPSDRPLSHQDALGDGDTHRAHLDAQRAMARAALSATDIPDDMRRALHSVLDHGLPDVAGMLGLRGEVPRLPGGGAAPLWDVLGFMAGNQALLPLLFGRGDLASGIKRGMPLREALSHAYAGLTDRHLRGIREAHAAGSLPLRRLPDLDPDEDGTCPGPNPALVLLAFSFVPADWVPHDEEGWKAFTEVVHAMDALMAATGSDPGTLLRPSKGRWRTFLDRCLVAVNGDSLSRTPCQDLRDAASLMGDVGEALAQDVVLPMLAHSLRDGGADLDPLNPAGDWSPLDLAKDVARELVFAGRGIPSALELSDDWHERSFNINAAVRTGGDLVEWPSLFPAPVRLGGIEIVAVADSASLMEEGSPRPDRAGVPGMGHCVAGRMPYAASGRIHILSLRRVLPGGYERLSTAEVRVEPRPGCLSFKVVEHSGVRNDDVPPEAEAALATLAARVRDGSQPVVDEALAFRPAPVAAGEVSRICGYDWTRPEAVSNAIAAWSEFLPRWTRGMGPGELMAACLERGYLEPGWQTEVGWARASA